VRAEIDNTAAAERLFRDFAARHAFTIEKLDEPHVELLMRVPEQPGLSFELTLGLQNRDELNIGFAGFWSYFFPFEKKVALVDSALDGIVTGECRLAIHRQFGRIVKHVLEQRNDGRWEVVYTALETFLYVPFVGTLISYRHNKCCRTKP
jgi:hypothetical protein